MCPKEGAAYADKGYIGKDVEQAAAKRGVHLAVIKKTIWRTKIEIKIVGLAKFALRMNGFSRNKITV